MIKCEYCNSSVDETLGTCPHCGAPLPAATTSTANTEAAGSEETTFNTNNTTTTSSTAGTFLDGIASALFGAKRWPGIHPGRPVPPPMQHRQRHMPPGGHEGISPDGRPDRHEPHGRNPQFPDRSPGPRR